MSGSLDSVVFWEAKSFSKKRTEEPFSNSACCHLATLAWSSSNSKLAVVPRQGDRVALCDFQEGSGTWSYLSHLEGGSFFSGCLLHNSRYLLSGSEDSSVHIWDLKNRKIFRSFPGHTCPVTSVTCNYADQWLVSGGRDGSIIVHSVDSSTPRHFLQDPSDQPKPAINRLCFSQVEKGQFGSVSEDGTACVWSVESQRLLNKYSTPHTGPATDLCFSPSNNMLMISVGMDCRIKCYDIQTRKIVTEVSAPSPLSSVTMLKDGSTLLAGGADGKLYVYELRTVKYPKTTLDGHKTAITCVAQQSYSKYSSRSKSSRSSSSSISGKRTSSSSQGSSTPEGITETPAHLSSTDSPANHLLGDQAPPPSRAAAPSSKQDSVAITPFITQTSQQRTNTGDALSTGSPTVFSTPASHKAQTSSIFSPLDPNLVTPAPGRKETVRGAALATPISSDVTSTTHPEATPHPIPPLPTTSETSGIFSPLDSGGGGGGSAITRLAAAVSRQPVASPLLIAHTQAERNVPSESSGRRPNSRASTSEGGRAEECNLVLSGSAATDVYNSRVVGGGMKSKALVPTTGQVQLADLLERQSLETPSQPSNFAPSSTHSMFSSLPDSATSSSGDHPSVDGNIDANNEHRGGAVAPPPSGAAAPPTNNIQMKYLEAMIKDAHEETLQAVHRDIRALSVDNIKFFCSLQQQSASQHTALVEKIDRLSEELRQVQEMVHQYMPKH